MKKTNLLYLVAILAIISGLFLYYLPSMNLVQSAHDSKSSHTFKAKTIVHDFGTTELKKAPKRIVILDNLYGEILEPLDLTPVGATTEQEGSQEFPLSLRNTTRMQMWSLSAGKRLLTWKKSKSSSQILSL